MGNDDYEPGPQYEPPSHRRRRQRRGEFDDAWAAADEDADFYDGADVEDFAAGYVDHEQIRRRDTADASDDEWHDGEQWSSSVTRARGRNRYARPPRRATDRADLYRRRPTHYRDRMSRGEYGEFRSDAYKAKRSFAPYQSSPGLSLTIPFWQILIIVILAMAAIFAVALACITLLLI